MYCTNCGSQIDDDTKFCPNCGAKQEDVPAQQETGGAQEQQAAQEQRTAQPQTGDSPRADNPPRMQNQQYTWQNGPAAYPQKQPKNKGLKIALLSVGGACIIALAVLLVLLLRPGSGNVGAILNAEPTVDMNQLENAGTDEFSLAGVGDGASGDTDTTPGNNSGSVDFEIVTQQPSETQSGQDTGSLKYYDTPGQSEVPMYTVLTEGVWTSVGLATNSYQISGENGVFTLDYFEDCMYYVEFFNDLTFNIRFDEEGYVSDEMYDYEIMDTAYCDSYLDEDGLGIRFYYGADGRLYMCIYMDLEDGTYPDASDFFVFEQMGDTVDWGA